MRKVKFVADIALVMKKLKEKKAGVGLSIEEKAKIRSAALVLIAAHLPDQAMVEEEGNLMGVKSPGKMNQRRKGGEVE